MKTTLSIPDKLFYAAEQRAKELGIPRSAFYSRALELLLARVRPRNITALLNTVYARESSELDPTFTALHSLTLPAEKWD